jgi:hypothetical protein
VEPSFRIKIIEINIIEGISSTLHRGLRNTNDSGAQASTQKFLGSNIKIPSEKPYTGLKQ